MKINFFDFYKLGYESNISFKNIFIRKFVQFFGPLGINAKIRSGHVLNHIFETNINDLTEFNVLDVGCGVAYIDIWLAKRFPEWVITAIDINSSAIDKANTIKNFYSLKNLKIKQENIIDMSLNEVFDLVYSMDVLEHIVDDIGALRKIYLALKNNGILILHLPLCYELNKRILPGFADFITIDHVRPEYTFDDICKKLSEIGFEVEKKYFTYSAWGELAFELNYLCWKFPKLRLVFAFITHFLSNILAFIDINQNSESGNGLIIRAKKVGMNKSCQL